MYVVYDDGAVFLPSVLDIQEEDLLKRFADVRQALLCSNAIARLTMSLISPLSCLVGSGTRRCIVSPNWLSNLGICPTLDCERV